MKNQKSNADRELYGRLTELCPTFIWGWGLSVGANINDLFHVHGYQEAYNPFPRVGAFPKHGVTCTLVDIRWARREATDVYTPSVQYWYMLTAPPLYLVSFGNGHAPQRLIPCRNEDVPTAITRRLPHALRSLEERLARTRSRFHS